MFFKRFVSAILIGASLLTVVSCSQNPLDETAFANKMKEILSGYTKGKDAGKIRIVIKRKVSEE